MTLSQILILSANMLDDNVLATSIANNSFDTDTTTKVNLLISCANQVANLIALDHVHIYGTKAVSTSNGRVSISTLCSNGIFGVASVTSGGVECKYSIEGDTVVTTPGQVKIKYLCQPSSLSSLSQVVSEFPLVPARIFAYGITAEYLYIKGNMYDAEAWNNRFEKAINALTRSTKNRIIKARRWY